LLACAALIWCTIGVMCAAIVTMSGGGPSATPYKSVMPAKIVPTKMVVSMRRAYGTNGCHCGVILSANRYCYHRMTKSSLRSRARLRPRLARPDRTFTLLSCALRKRAFAPHPRVRLQSNDAQRSPDESSVMVACSTTSPEVIRCRQRQICQGQTSWWFST
jgi:hypothetical protein